MREIRSVAILALVLAGSVIPASPIAHAQQLPAVPVGFAVTPYAQTRGLTTSITFGPDTRDLTRSRLYAAVFSSGQIVAIDDTGGVGPSVSTFATGFRNPLGVVVAPDGTVFVADSEAPRQGPFGTRAYGRVWRVRDTNRDGVADVSQVVLKDLPNGRHNTNGMAIGPDGMLYVTNGNSTDDGVEGGEPEVVPWSGSVIRVNPAWTGISLASLKPRDVLVAEGMRNDFDVAFSPFDRTHLFITMNGTDDARQEPDEGPTGLEDSDDLLYRADIDDTAGTGAKAKPAIEDFGFPSCLYNLERRGNLDPYDNPNPETIERFGPCAEDQIVRPLTSFGLHVSADGLAFQTTNAWGQEFRNDLFVAEFGNFFGPEVVGHRVVRVELDAKGRSVTRRAPFLSGAVPLDVTFDRAGAMYVADFSGTIFKVQRVA